MRRCVPAVSRLRGSSTHVGGGCEPAQGLLPMLAVTTAMLQRLL